MVSERFLGQAGFEPQVFHRQTEPFSEWSSHPGTVGYCTLNGHALIDTSLIDTVRGIYQSNTVEYEENNRNGITGTGFIASFFEG